MEENVGRTDRIVRSIVGPALIALGYASLGGRKGRASGLVAMLLGNALVETAITRVCPLNYVLGIDTRSPAERARDRHVRWLEFDRGARGVIGPGERPS